MFCEECNRVFIGVGVDFFAKECPACRKRKEINQLLDGAEKKMETEEKSYKDRLEELYEAALELDDIRLAFDIAAALQNLGS